MSKSHLFLPTLVVFFISSLTFAQFSEGDHVRPDQNPLEVIKNLTPEQLQQKLKELQSYVHPRDPANETQQRIREHMGPQLFKLVHTITDSRILDPALDILNNKKGLKYLAIGQFLFILLFLLYRSWQSSKIKIWYKVFLFNLISMVVFWLGSTLLVPYLIYGKTYTDLIKNTYNVVNENYQ